MADNEPNEVDLSIGKIFKVATNSLMFTGFLILMACVGTLTRNSTIGLLTGYGFIIVGTLMFTSVVVQKMSKSTNVDATTIMSGVVTIGPMVTFMITLTMLTYLVSKHFELIANGKVSGAFSGMLSLMSVIIMLTLFMFRKVTTSERYKETGAIDKVSGMGIYFLNLIGVVILKTIYIILTFYTTDG